MPENATILVTGATGYIGGELIPALLERGYRVRCLARDPRRIHGSLRDQRIEVFNGDVTDYPSLARAMGGVTAAYYLVHSMGSGKDYVQLDLKGAENFAAAAAANGIEHIIYLGGLADPNEDIGFHMRSRIQTGEMLRRGSVPVTEFRASLIIGSGSISFEMIRYLTEQFPVLAGPRWINYHAQPIAIQNVVAYLLAALDNPACRGKIYEIGGTDVLTYRETLLAYARMRGLNRLVLMIPGLPVAFMAFLVDRATPVEYAIASPLIEGMRSHSVVKDRQAAVDFPQVALMDYRSAVRSALEKLTPAELNRVWENRGSTVHLLKEQGFLLDCKQETLDVTPQAAYQAIAGLGGNKGWLYFNALWKLRGLIDRLLGGPGMRGRPQKERLNAGDLIDFYHVDCAIPGELLRLQADLKAPGSGWMEWSVKSQPGGKVNLSQLAFFAPRGVPGFLYWYLLLPIHEMVFAGMFRKLIAQAKELQKEETHQVVGSSPKVFF